MMFFRVLFNFLRIAWVILVKNNWYTHRTLYALQKELNLYNMTLSEPIKKRIQFYTAQSAITNLWFSTLRGYRPTKEEVEYAQWLGAFTPIADDLMDDEGTPFEVLEMNPSNHTPSHILFTFLIEKLKPLRTKKPDFDTYFGKATYFAQNESLKQLSKEPLALEEITKITYDKGGYATLLYRMILQNSAVEGEENCIYTLGAILQLLNDLFDMHKDYHNGAQTLVTRTADVSYIRRLLKDLETNFVKSYFSLDYQSKNIEESLIAILAITTRGYVALEQYEKLQGVDSQINISAYSRKPLIVDMEKLENIWKSFRITIQLMNEFKIES
jgi:hypothetical protein